MGPNQSDWRPHGKEEFGPRERHRPPQTPRGCRVLCRPSSPGLCCVLGWKALPPTWQLPSLLQDLFPAPAPPSSQTETPARALAEVTGWVPQQPVQSFLEDRACASFICGAPEPGSQPDPRCVQLFFVRAFAKVSAVWAPHPYDANSQPSSRVTHLPSPKTTL